MPGASASPAGERLSKSLRRLRAATETATADDRLLACLLVIATLALINILQLMAEILVPLVFAMFLTYIADPIANLMTKYPNEQCCMRYCLSRKRRKELRQNKGVHIQQQAAGRTPSDNDNRSQNLRERVVRTSSEALRGDPRKDIEQPFLEDATADERKIDDDDVEISLLSYGGDTGIFETDMLNEPCACCLRNCFCPRWLAVTVTMLVLLGIMSFVGYLVAISVEEVEAHWEDVYIPGAQQFAAWLASILSRIGLTLETDIEPYLVNELESLAASFAAQMLAFTESFVFCLIFLVYLLLSPIRPRQGALYEMDQQIRMYIHLKTMVSTMVGLSVGVCFTILRVDLAWIFALTTFVCNFIPNVGAIVATLLPLPLIILDINLPVSSKVLAFAIPFCLHNFIGNFVEPFLFGARMEIHPIVVLVALGVWTVVWGVPGAILAVPLIAIMRIGVDQIDHPFASAISKLLSGNIFDKYGHIEDPLVEISDSMAPSPSISAKFRNIDKEPGAHISYSSYPENLMEAEAEASPDSVEQEPINLVNVNKNSNVNDHDSDSSGWQRVPEPDNFSMEPPRAAKRP